MSEQTNFSDSDFAQEVRIDRLALLWRVTLFGAVAIFWLALVLATFIRFTTAAWMYAMGALVGGCLLTGWLLKRDYFDRAVRAYAGGVLIAVAFFMLSDNAILHDIVPYTFPLLIFVVGLLLPVTALPTLIGLVLAVMFGTPLLRDGTLLLTEHNWAALILTLVSALVAAQTSGELYAIAEWALSSYRRERDRKLELHESQRALKKTLARAQVLAETLEEKNVELEDAWAEAEEAKTFRGKFLANMSHELRTPLNAVMGFSETMLNFPDMYGGVPLPDEYQQDMEQIYTSGAQLLHVINDILDLSRVDAGKLDIQLQEVDLEPLLKATFSTAVGLIGDKPIAVRRDLPPVLPLLWADPNRVRQVLLNLFSNAVKFTDEGMITLGLRTQDGMGIFSVTDTGVGIPAEEHELIFEEFKQGRAGLNQARKGSGLGLAISKNLVALMGGDIWVESTVGVGSVFYFSLPLFDPPEAVAPLEAAPALKTPV